MKRGFTLIELITVVVIIGVLVSFALPQYNVTVERSRSSEGITILSALRQAELRYQIEHNTFVDGMGPTLLNKLDVEITSSHFFVLNNVSPNATLGPPFVLNILRNSEQYSFGTAYWLRIDSEGNIGCTNNPDLCRKMGYHVP